jgi:hypothetical protein
MAGDAVAVRLLDRVNSLSVNIQTMAGDAVAVLLLDTVNSLLVNIQTMAGMLWLSFSWMSQLSINGWLFCGCAVARFYLQQKVFAVDGYSRFQAKDGLFLWLWSYWKGSTFKPKVSCCCGCALLERVKFQTNG